MKVSGVSIIWEYEKKRYVVVVALVLESKGL